MKCKTFLLLISLFMASINIAFSTEFLIFAGSGMRSPLEDLGRNFASETGVEVFYDFDGSGRLGSKILAGIMPDVFIPGSEKWVAKLKSRGYVKKCFPIAYHVPVIITPKGQRKVKTLNDLTNKSCKLALGNIKTSAIGQNSQRLFENLGINTTDMNIVARGIAVKQLVQWVESGAVDAAIAWRADAIQSKRVEMIELPPESISMDTISLCLMNAPPHPETVAEFCKYLLENGSQVFAKYGFQVIKSK